MHFFQAVVAPSGAWIINNLMQPVVSQKPIECNFHFQTVIFLSEYIIKFTQCHYGISHINGLFTKALSFLSFFQPVFVGNYFYSIFIKCSKGIILASVSLDHSQYSKLNVKATRKHEKHFPFFSFKEI